jgi:FAD binding domain-containing protein
MVTLPVDKLRARVRGPVLVPSDRDYAAEVSGFDPSVRQRADVVVGAATTEDVVAAVDFAREHRLRVSVQGSGHADLPGLEGGMLITLHRLSTVSVDPVARRAVIGAGTTWTDVLPHCEPYGLAPLCGSAPNVGAVGYLLGGGMGPIGRTFGFSCDKVLEFDVITADGKRRTVSADSEPDLFWALRGGKGALAVVLSAVVELVELSEIWGGSWYVADSDIPAALAAFQQLTTSDLTEALTLSFAILRLPDLSALPEELRGRTVGHVRVGYAGEPEMGAELIAPLQAVAPAVLGGVGPLPYAQIGSIHQDPVQPSVHATAGTLLREFPPEAIAAILANAGPDTASPLTIAEVRHLGGAFAHAPAVPDAVGGREAEFGVWISSVIVAESRRSQCQSAVRTLVDALRPWATGGVQINFSGSENTAAEFANAWPSDIAERLAEVRRNYDPNSLLYYQPVADSAGP